MAGLDTIKSTSITNLDTVPIIKPTAGAGGLARSVNVDDYCAATAAGLQSAGSWYRLVRVPTWAVVKSVELGSDAGPNLSGSALAVDLNWVFSDSTDDGTPVSLQGLIPQSGNTGTTTTIASYTTPNKMYGTWKPAAAATAIEPTNLVFNNVAGYPFTGGLMNLPLYQLFGFTDGRGNPSDPGGYFDLVAYVATGATTGGACNIYAKVSIADKG
jgi:hypothetical protein